MSWYVIDRGLLEPPLEVEIDGIPPCLWCETPVIHRSTGGPLICGPCDLGLNQDGSRKTHEDHERGAANYRRRIAEYKSR